MDRICIVTGAHLCRNPRVVKEATALADAGYDVTVLGPRTDLDLARQDEGICQDAAWTHTPTVDITSGVEGHLHRAIRRGGMEGVARLGFHLPDALGYGVRRTLSAARREAADLTIGHQEVGLWVASALLNDGARVGADFEDWYSRDLPSHARVGRPVRLLAELESELVQRGHHISTTSHALAQALAESYDGPAPTVIYNAFPWEDRGQIDGSNTDRHDHTLPSLHWVSQTLGPGRGLDVLFDALRDVTSPVQVHLRGNPAPGSEAALRSAFPTNRNHQLFFHGLVPPHELLSRISEHDIGFAFEDTSPDSRDLTVTNKILHYLLGGLAVVASRTSGQSEIAAATPTAVHLCDSSDAKALAVALNHLLSSTERLQAAKQAALEAARERFSWEHQTPRLLASVTAALDRTL